MLKKDLPDHSQQVEGKGVITHLLDSENDCVFSPEEIQSKSEYLEQVVHPFLPREQERALLQQLYEFPLGRFLLKNRGFNGYWTAYMIFAWTQQKTLHPLEEWILTRAPVVRASQERFQIFRAHLQAFLKENIVMASVPCGLMEDLLSLEDGPFHSVQRVGIDLDQNSLELAKQNAKRHGKKNVQFLKRDAWKLGVENAYDVLTSNGLNIYEKDDKRIVALYREFFKALKPGGVLVTSFLTPPPQISFSSPWQGINPADLLKQKALFNDIIQVSWQSFSSEQRTRERLDEAGFSEIRIFYDNQRMFPTVLAVKKAS